MNFALIFSISSDVSFLYSFTINVQYYQEPEETSEYYNIILETNPESIYNFKTTPLNVDLFSSGIM